MNNKSLISLGVVAVIVVGAIFFLESQKIAVTGGPVVDQSVDISQTPAGVAAQKEKKYQFAKEIVNPAGFINTDDITIQELIGKKVILIDFWTYSCINCQRTLPYLTSWYSKYKDQGLEIIGMHTPEFEFEKKIANVQQAVSQWGIDYPVVLDNDYGTWRNYKNLYWPRKYIIDIDGFVVYDHIGEGGYQETEKVIQQLLAERNDRLELNTPIATGFVNPDAEEVNRQMPRSPETYFGASRNEFLGNGAKNVLGLQSFKQPNSLETNILYLAGDWDVQSEYAENKKAGAKIVYKFTGQKVFIVARADQEIKADILIDGVKIDGRAGSDVVDGTVKIQQDRLYRLFEDPTNTAEHVLEIIINDAGLQAFAFTFG